MKHFIFFLLILFTISATSQAQVPLAHFGVHGNLINAKLNAELREIAGVPPPSGAIVTLEEVYGLGYGGGLHLDLDIGLLSFRLSGDYVTLSPDKEKFASFINASLPGVPLVYQDGGVVTLLSGTVNAKLVILPLPVVKPYLTGGGGIAGVKATDVTLTFAGNPVPPFPIIESQTVGTYNLGAGVDLGLGSLTLYGEVKVTWIMIKEGTSTYVPIGTVGITF